MSEPTPDKSIQSYVRTGGALYLYIIFAGIFAQVFVRSQLIVSADAACWIASEIDPLIAL